MISDKWTTFSDGWMEVSDYLFVKRQLDMSQKDNYKSRFKRIYTYFENRPFNSASIVSFIKELRESYSASSTALYIIMLKHICEYMSVDYLKGFKLPKRNKVQKNVLEDDEMKKVVDTAYRHNYRYALAIEMALRMGVRLNVVRNLRWEDIHDKYIVIRDDKDGNQKMKPLPRTVREKFHQLDRWKNGYVFETRNGRLSGHAINNFLRSILNEAGIEKDLTFHDLRHSCATDLLNNGVDIRFIQEQLDHKSITTTELYTHVSMKSLEKVMNKHSLSLEYMTNADMIQELRGFADRLTKAKFILFLTEESNEIRLSIRRK